MISTRFVLAATGVALLSAAPATAQVAPPSWTFPLPFEVRAGERGSTFGLLEAKNEDQVDPYTNVTVRRYEDMDVVDVTGEKVAEVRRVLMTPDGRIVALRVHVDGIDAVLDKDRILDLGSVRVEGDRLLVAMTREQMRTLPAWAG